MPGVLKEKDSTHGKEGYVKMGAEIGVMQLQAKKDQGLLATTRNKGKEQIIPQNLQKNQPRQQLEC